MNLSGVSQFANNVINAASSAATGTGTTSSTSDPNQLTGDSFLTLLTAQLKSQDPTAPTDPTQFVGQLVQFNTLQQIIQIRQLLQQSTSPTTGSTPAA